MTDTHNQDELKRQASHVLETYGADPDRWPVQSHDALVQTIENDPLLIARLAEEKALDDLLALAPVEAPSLALQSGILKVRAGDEGVAGTNVAVAGWKQVLDAFWPFGSAIVPAGALVTAVVLGSSFGFVTTNANNIWSDQGTYDVVALALGDTTLSEEWQ